MVKLTKEVYDQLEEVRAGGECNMFDRNCVLVILEMAQSYEAVDWIEDNPKTYARLIMEGPEVADKSDTDE